MQPLPLPDWPAACAIAVLLVLTALGDAVALLLTGILGLAVVALLAPRGMARGSALASTASFALAIAIALVTLAR